MKIGMLIISNRPKDLEQFLETIHLLGGLNKHIKICAILQPPFTSREKFLSLVDSYELVENKGEPVPFVWYRKRAMLLAKDCDWLWSLDDDHRFADSSGELFNKTCEEYYSDVFDWLEKSNTVGALSCRGYVGGYQWGYDFKINPKNGLVATDKGGIFIRNIGVDKIIELEEENLVGALFESLAIYNVLSYNYKLGRRYNSPVKNRPPGKKKHIGGSGVSSYSDGVVGNNIQKRIREKFNDLEWTHSSRKYPKQIAEIIGVHQC